MSSKSLQAHLDKEIRLSHCGEETTTLNDLLIKAIEAESYDEIKKVDEDLVCLLNTEYLTDDRREVIEFVLEQIQMMYEPSSTHKEISPKKEANFIKSRNE